MSFIKDFKEFAMRGNVMDMAVGVIIGGAFGKIISSLVDDIIMPLVGKVLGNADFTNLYIGLSGQECGLPLEKAKEAGAVFAYGQFCQNVIDFLIIAFCIFLININIYPEKTKSMHYVYNYISWCILKIGSDSMLP